MCDSLLRGGATRTIDPRTKGLTRTIEHLSLDPDRWFNCCSCAAAAAAISLSSVACAVAADRPTTAVAGGGGKWIRRNYELIRIVDRSID